MTEVEAIYEDPIIRMIQDPELSRDKEKTNELVKLISGFALTERKVSKLCQSSLSILQTLEKVKLKFKSWEFLSLDYNSDTHFNETESEHVKSFNNSIAAKVLTACKELNNKLNRISIDIDYITKASRTLTPIEYISDSGTLLTSLLLRIIKLKNEVVDKLTVAYLKAKLISIGQELETMLEQSGSEEDMLTVTTYKSFIVNLLKQLNNAIDNEDNGAKYECLAVINDMEKMFEAFKVEKAREASWEVKERENKTQKYPAKETPEFDYVDIAEQAYKEREQEKGFNESEFEERELGEAFGAEKQYQAREDQQTRAAYKEPETKARTKPHSESLLRATPRSIRRSSPRTPEVNDDFDYLDSEYGDNSVYLSLHHGAMVHSITKSHSPHNSEDHKHSRRDSMSSLSTSTLFQKTTISEELPFLMTAFSSAKNFEEDVNHFKEELLSKVFKKHEGLNEKATEEHHKPVFSHKNNLPENSLYSESTILKKPSPAASYIYANNSLLSKLGIRPQVITAKELGERTNHTLPAPPKRLYVKLADDEEKENTKIPLTKANLQSHTISSLPAQTTIAEYVD